METKNNQDTLFKPVQSREINTINLEHNSPLVEHTLGSTHSILSSSKNEAVSDPGSISTTKLFTKPIVFAPDLEWSVDLAQNELIFNQPLLDIFETLRRSPGGQSLRAHTFFRSGARVQLKLSSSPFHSGKLVFYYVPPGVNNTFRESIFAKVQYPCVYVDAGNSTTAELNIPFVTIKDFFATQNPDRLSDYGSVCVAVFNRLAIGSAGPTTVNFALSLHPTENQIALPVLAHDIVLQAGIVPMLASVLPEVLPSLLEGSAPVIGSAIGGAAAGSALTSVVSDLTNREQQNLVHNLQRDNDDLRNKNNTSSPKDLNVSAPSLSNMTGLGTEHLSLYPEATYVKNNEPHSPRDDEMDLLRIARVPSLIHTGLWFDTDAPNSVLLKFNVDPMTIPSTPTTNNVFTAYPTYLAHVTEPFAYWRGSIDYHFTFACTQQHKGKIIVAWIPYDSISDNMSAIEPNPTVESLSLYPNEIFDLSLNSEFVFSVPYNTETPYRETSDYYNRLLTDGSFVDNATQNTSLGTLYIMVYNRLSHPSTVTSSINYNCFIRAGSDYQLRALRYRKGDPNTYEKFRYITLQSGLDVSMESSRSGMERMSENRVGETSNHVSNTVFQDDPSEHNIGYLLSKYYPQVGIQFSLETNSTRRVNIANLPGILHRAPRVTAEADPRWRNLISHFRDIFAFWHGSLNYFLIHNSTVNTPILLVASHDPTGTTSSSFLVPSGSENQLNDSYGSFDTNVEEMANVDLSETAIYSHISNLRVNPTIEVTTPYRSIYRRLYTTDSVTGASENATQVSCAGTLDLIYSNPSSTDIPVSALLFQSVGSDFRFKYLIPPPSLRSLA
uniref:Structural polyprotein n=1 Tax=Darwin bee virus 6 TaxID=2201281 RepID=A0A2U8JQ64_9VIRU|nr:structural polyprotein [Darwin bee virus 6]